MQSTITYLCEGLSTAALRTLERFELVVDPLVLTERRKLDKSLFADRTIKMQNNVISCG